MVSYAVTGANRGLGFEYIRQLSLTPTNIIFALVRNPSPPSIPKLSALAATNKNIHILQGDITSLPQLQKAAEEISKITGGTLDVLVNNAGFVEGETAGLVPSSLSEEGNLEKVVESLNKSIETNVLGAIYVTNALLPLILKGEQKKIVHITSGMADTELVLKSKVAYAVPYSASKAALNLVVAKYAAELAPKGIKVLALSPGWVDTDEFEPTAESKGAVEFMAGLFRNVKPDLRGRIMPEESVRDQLDTIGRFEGEWSGRMVSQHGNEEWF